MAAEGYVTISPRLSEYLDAISRDGVLQILRIDDVETKGLLGDEDEVDSNSNLLCRHTLITAGGRRESGGSFGLGKSVLWLFSGLSTVLFSSNLGDDGNRIPLFRSLSLGMALD